MQPAQHLYISGSLCYVITWRSLERQMLLHLLLLACFDTKHATHDVLIDRETLATPHRVALLHVQLDPFAFDAQIVDCALAWQSQDAVCV
jgi:hypothetical protein